MVRLAVINLKTCLKGIAKVMVIFLIFGMVFRLASLVYQKIKNFDFVSSSMENGVAIIGSNLPILQGFQEEKKQNSSIKKILMAQFALFSGAEEEIMERENKEEVLDFENKEQEAEQNWEKIEEISSQEVVTNNDVQEELPQTSVVASNNKKDVFTDIYHTVQIKNESDYVLTEEMITPDIGYSDGEELIIYHTHTCESYTQTENSSYVATGNYRTTDLNYSVARVGTELANYLAVKGYTVIHDTTCHDYPAYTGSYTRSLTTVKNLLNTYKNVDCVFDIHRDALRK